MRIVTLQNKKSKKMKRIYFNFKKIISLMSFAVFMLISQSCSDVLKEEVISGVGNDYINTPAGFNAAINSAYASDRKSVV